MENVPQRDIVVAKTQFGGTTCLAEFDGTDIFYHHCFEDEDFAIWLNKLSLVADVTYIWANPVVIKHINRFLLPENIFIVSSETKRENGAVYGYHLALVNSAAKHHIPVFITENWDHPNVNQTLKNMQRRGSLDKLLADIEQFPRTSLDDFLKHGMSRKHQLDASLLESPIKQSISGDEILSALQKEEIKQKKTEYYAEFHPPPIVIPDTHATVYTDASQALDGASAGVLGWIKQPDHSKPDMVEFGFTITRQFDSTRLEALGILTAILANKDIGHLTIYSDSINGAKLALETIRQVRNNEIIGDAFLRGHIRRSILTDVVTAMVIKIKWVKAHAGYKWNECVNHLVISTRHNVDELFLFDEEDLRSRAETHLKSWLFHHKNMPILEPS